MSTENDSNKEAQMSPAMELGSSDWLRAQADDREEMLHALGAIDEDGERETKQEILGLRDAAAQMDRLRDALEKLELRVHTGYDFNSDPDKMTLLVGRALYAPTEASK